MTVTVDFGTAVGDELYAALAPIATSDEALGYPLRTYCLAIGSMFEEINWYVSETDTMPGWSRLADIDTTPAKALGWLAQIVGVTLDPALDDDAQRERIRATDGFQRGTVGALVAAAQQYLTGAKQVVIHERVSDAYTLTVITYTAQTPDSAAVLAALVAQKPAGLILTLSVRDGQDFAQLLAGHATFALVKSDYSTFADVRDDI